MTKIKVAVTGAAGRMGRQIISGIMASEELELQSAFERRDNPAIGELIAAKMICTL